MESSNRTLSPEGQAVQRHHEAQMAEVRRNIAAAEARERERLAERVAEANAGVNAWVAEQQAAAQQAEREREAARQAEAQQRQVAEREQARLRYLDAGGDVEGFDRWYAGEQRRLVNERMEQQQIAARRAARDSF
jgi:hypothetical protein